MEIEKQVKTLKVKKEGLKKKELRNRVISIRTYDSICKWMKENKISPSFLFNECAKELMNRK